MTLKQHLGVSGLATDPNLLPADGGGALAIAREVVIRRKGFVEPRPGFAVETDDPEILHDLKALIPFGGDVLHVGSDVEGDGDPYNAYWPQAEQEVRDGNDAALLWATNAIRGTEARENLYLTTEDNVRRLMTADDTDALCAGLLPPTVWRALQSGAGPGAIIPNNTTVAYRAIFEVKLASGLILRSAPSGRVVYRNESGSAQNAEVHAGGAPADPEIPGAVVTLKIYRSISDNVDVPPDELFLAISEVDPSPTVSARFDPTFDQDLGEALYTNTKQEGIARQNIRPPACKDIALFNRSLFFANITRHARFDLSWVEGGDLTAAATGIGYRTYDGERTNGSDTIENLSDTVGLKKGMILDNRTGWAGSGPVYIVEFVGGPGGSITMSEDWAGSTDGAPVAITFVDALWVAPHGENFSNTHAYRADQLNAAILGINAGTAANNSGTVASSFAFAVGITEVSRYIDITYEPPVGPVAMTIEGISALQELHIVATHGAEYNPPLPLWEDEFDGPGNPFDGDATAVPEELPNGIAWTKSDQPEHHMLGAVELVGHQTHGLARIVAGKNALWLLKDTEGDSYYRLSGSDELNGWRVDKQEPDKGGLCLLAPDLVASYGDAVYAWTDKGLKAISDAGAIPVSRDYVGSDTAPIERRRGFQGAFAVTNHKDHEVIFGLPADAGEEDPYAEVVYVVNLKTGSITTWFHSNPLGFRCAAYHNDQLYFGPNDIGWAHVERTAGDNWDAEFAIDISTTDENNVVTLTAPVVGWTPAIGDTVFQDDQVAYITALDDASTFTVNDASVFEAGAATARVAFSSVAAWLPKTAEGPSLLKRFSEVITHWDSRIGMYQWAVAFNAYIGSGNAASQSYINPDHAIDRIFDHRTLVGRSVAMASRLLPGVTIRSAGARWRLSGVTMISEPISTRLHR